MFLSISRPGKYGLTRFVVKRYVEKVLSQSDPWKRLSVYFPQISSSLRSYALTHHETQLMQLILDYHLKNSLHLKISQSNDQLIDYENLIDFISRIQVFRKETLNLHHAQSVNVDNRSIQTIPSTPSVYTLPSIEKPLNSRTLSSSQKPPCPLISQPNITQPSTTMTNNHHASSKSVPSSPLPISSSKPKEIGSGWIQINNVYLPFIVKNQRRFVPYEVLIVHKILQPDELTTMSTRATSSDTALMNAMASDRKIGNQEFSEQCALIDIRYILIGANKLIYMKILPSDHPPSKINHQYASVLTLQGGFLTISNQKIPFVCSNNHCYISLNDICTIYPLLRVQLKRLARVPRANELDYLQLIQMYSMKKELPLDTELISMTDINQRHSIPSKSLTLVEYQATEKAKLEAFIRSSAQRSPKKRKHLESYSPESTRNRCFPPHNGHRGRAH